MFERLKKEFMLGRTVKFVASIALAVGLAAVVFTLLLFKLNSDFFKRGFLDIMETSAHGAAAGLDSFMDEKAVALQHISKNESVMNYLLFKNDETSECNEKKDSVEEVLGYAMSIDPEISFSWIVSDLNNSILLHDGEKTDCAFDMRSRSWYPQLITKAGKGNIWYTQAIAGPKDETTVSAVTAIEKNGNVIGYVGFSTYADMVSNIVNNMNFSEGVYPIIVSDDGRIIYESDDENFKAKFQLSASVINGASKGASVQELGVHKIKTDNGSRYISYMSSEIPTWNYLFCFDNDKLNERFAAVSLAEMLLTVLFSLLVLVLVYVKLRGCFKALPHIQKTAKAVKGGNYTEKCDVGGNGAIAEIAQVIDSLQDGLIKKDLLIEEFTYTDPLTGLANRRKIYECIAERIGDSEKAEKFAIVYLDIDNFQWINDTLGHGFGDEYLKQFSLILNSVVEKHGVLSRFSADEFVFLAWDIDGAGEVNVVIAKIMGAFEAPIAVFSDEIYAKFSIGVSFYPDDDSTPELLIRDADLAMSIAKEHRARRVVEYYNRSLYTNISNKAFIAKGLIPALDNNEFYLNYQPIISTSSRSIHGFEVLLRWKNSEIGNIPPSEFIHVAEETGAIIPIGTWIFESACRFQKAISEKFDHPINISINVSPKQLFQTDYISNIKMVVGITQIDPKFIQIEITEGILIELVETANNVLMELCDMGFSIALDDFGTGYSSLNYLKRFPIKCLKIDKSFIDEIYSNKKDYAITDSIIDLVHSLDITTVAEGVETKGQLESLSAMNCDLIQGYLFSKPLDEYQAIDFVRKYDDIHSPWRRDANFTVERRKMKGDRRKKSGDRRNRSGETENSDTL